MGNDETEAIKTVSGWVPSGMCRFLNLLSEEGRLRIEERAKRSGEEQTEVVVEDEFESTDDEIESTMGGFFAKKEDIERAYREDKKMRAKMNFEDDEDKHDLEAQQMEFDPLEDQVLLVGSIDSLGPVLEVNGVNAGNVWSLYEIILGYFPVATAWFPNLHNDQMCLVAVAGLNSQIEIYNIADVDTTTPVMTLGAPSKLNPLSGDIEYPPLSEHSHGEAVISLALNPANVEELSSASADCTCKMWDLADGVCTRTLHLESKAVICQYIASPNACLLIVLAESGQGHIVSDKNQDDVPTLSIKDQLAGETVECGIVQIVSDVNLLIVGTNQGRLLGISLDSGGPALFEISVFAQKDVSSVVIVNTNNSNVSLLLVTSSASSKVHIYELTKVEGSDTFSHRRVARVSLGIEKILHAAPNPDNSRIIAYAGSETGIMVLDRMEETAKYFS